MIVEKFIGFPVSERLYGQVCDILAGEFGLVDGINENPSDKHRVLVWEDNQGIGRYRVHCFKDDDAWRVRSGSVENHDIFAFHYWTSKARFDRDVFTKDPMQATLKRVLALSNNIYVPKDFIVEDTVEGIERNLGR